MRCTTWRTSRAWPSGSRQVCRFGFSSRCSQSFTASGVKRRAFERWLRRHDARLYRHGSSRLKLGAVIPPRNRGRARSVQPPCSRPAQGLFVKRPPGSRLATRGAWVPDPIPEGQSLTNVLTGVWVPRTPRPIAPWTRLTRPAAQSARTGGPPHERLPLPSLTCSLSSSEKSVDPG
jgi:hypothetical protein